MIDTCLIRFAERKDLEEIIGLCQLHADFEKSKYFVEGKNKRLEEALFSKNARMWSLVAEIDERLVGYATYMKQYATWEAEEYVYLDCLFVLDGYRSLGIGARLVNRVKEETRLIDLNLIQWQTPAFNLEAIKFYERLGAHSNSKERFFLKV